MLNIPDCSLPNYSTPTETLSHLPASIESGKEHIDETNNERYMQPLVEYSINATAVYSITGNECPLTDLRRVVIRVLPRSQSWHELDTWYEKCQRKATSTAKISRFGGCLGSITISTEACMPIILDVSLPKSPANIQFKGVLQSSQTSRKEKFPRSMRCHVQSHIIKTTYFSTKHMREIPVDICPTHSSPIQMHTENTQSLIPCSKFDLVMKDSTVFIPVMPPGDWCGEANILVFPPLDDVPSFVSSFAARTYQYVIEFSFPEFRHKPLKLNLPIKTYYGGC